VEVGAGTYMAVAAVLFAVTAGVRAGVRTVAIVSLPETLDESGR
jgi:hypothetical protein